MKQPFLTIIILVYTLICGLPCLSQVTDVSGRVYMTVWIGDRSWMAENLDVALFSNGDPLVHCGSAAAWEKANSDKKPAWCYYNFDSTLGAKYGKLYNGFAITDKRGLAPKGWQIPLVADWDQLKMDLAKASMTEKDLKAFGDWQPEGSGASGFSALPAGRIAANGTSADMGTAAYWWTGTAVGGTTPMLRVVLLQAAAEVTVYADLPLAAGMSVRCIKK